MDYIPDKNVLLVNIGRLKKESYIDSNVNEKTLRTAIKYIQDSIVERVIGTCLFDKLKELICEDEICTPLFQYYKILLDDYLLPIFIHGVEAEISIPLSFKNRNAGTVRNVSDELIQATLDDIKYLNQFYNNKKDFYIKRAIDFLKCHRKEFPELKCCECPWYVQRPFNKDYSVPINLNIV